MMPLNLTELLAKKIDLETKWNKMFLESGMVTTEMSVLAHQHRDVMKEMTLKSADYNPHNYENHLFAS